MKAVTDLKPYFEHVEDYHSFNLFKDHVIHFLTTIQLKDLLDDSFAFSCANDYPSERQGAQIRAVNNVLDELYGKGRVQWDFDPYDEQRDNVWGVYLLIDDVKESLFRPSMDTTDTFIRVKLKSVSH